MTDEETGGDSHVLVRRMPPWCSTKLKKLMRALDSCKNAKSEAVPKNNRRIGSFSEKSPPNGLPKWVLQDPATIHETSLTDSSSIHIHFSVSSPEPPAQCSGTFALPSESSTLIQAKTQSFAHCLPPRYLTEPFNHNVIHQHTIEPPCTCWSGEHKLFSQWDQLPWK